MFSITWLFIYCYLITSLLAYNLKIISTTKDPKINRSAESKYLQMREKPRYLLNSKFKHFGHLFGKNKNNTTSMERAKKVTKKQKKLKSFIYPLLMGVLIAKLFLVPLTMKILTIISSSAFIISKVALAATGLLTLKWLLEDSTTNELKFSSLPSKMSQPYRYASGNIIVDDDQVWSSSQHKYIPLSALNENFYTNSNGKEKDNKVFPYYINNYNNNSPFL